MKDAKSKDSKQDPKSQKDLETTKEKRKEKAKSDINLDQLPFQDGIISKSKRHGLFLTVYLKRDMNLDKVKFHCSTISKLIEEVERKFIYESKHLEVVIGLSKELCQKWLGDIPQGFSDYKHLKGALGDFPYTGGDLFLHIKSNHMDMCFLFGKVFLGSIDECVEEFTDILGFDFLVGRNGLGRDLTGFEDGTANPKGPFERGSAALITSSHIGGSFFITQKWVHNLKSFEKLPISHQENIIGRTKEESLKIKPRPPQSHVALTDVNKLRIVRQSLPFGNLKHHGLFFIAYSNDCAKFDIMLNNLANSTEGLMEFSKCETGNYFYAPSKIELQKLNPQKIPSKL